MYSHANVMKLLEVQRKSIMEFEAAKYELWMNSHTEQVNEAQASVIETEADKEESIAHPDEFIRKQLLNIRTKYPEQWHAFYIRRFNKCCPNEESIPNMRQRQTVVKSISKYLCMVAKGGIDSAYF